MDIYEVQCICLVLALVFGLGFVFIYGSQLCKKKNSLFLQDCVAWAFGLAVCMQIWLFGAYQI